jgi:hypothetical protein
VLARLVKRSPNELLCGTYCFILFSLFVYCVSVVDVLVIVVCIDVLRTKAKVIQLVRYQLATMAFKSRGRLLYPTILV